MLVGAKHYTYPLRKDDLRNCKPRRFAKRVCTAVMDHCQCVTMLQNRVGVVDPLFQAHTTVRVCEETWVELEESSQGL